MGQLYCTKCGIPYMSMQQHSLGRNNCRYHRYKQNSDKCCDCDFTHRNCAHRWRRRYLC